MKKKKILYLSLLFSFLIEIITVCYWLAHCKYFHSNLHIDFSALWLQLSAEISQDKDVPYVLTRLFHNKFIDLFLVILKLYFRFWDLVLNQGLFSFVGTFGILGAGWYFLHNKVKRFWQWSLILAICLVPFVEIFFSSRIPFVIRICLYFVIFVPISLIGVKKFLLSWNKAAYVLIFLFILSIWWMLSGSFDFATYCIQYP